MKEAEKELNHAIGGRLRAARQARDLSLNELATLTGGLFSKSRISNYEQGIRRLSIEGAQTLSAALGNVSAAQLLCIDDSPAVGANPEEQQLLAAFRAASADGRRRLLECAAEAAAKPKTAA